MLETDGNIMDTTFCEGHHQSPSDIKAATISTFRGVCPVSDTSAAGRTFDPPKENHKSVPVLKRPVTSNPKRSYDVQPSNVEKAKSLVGVTVPAAQDTCDSKYYATAPFSFRIPDDTLLQDTVKDYLTGLP